ncbi:hypothetical protein M728_004054 (plasmid) [Ensifer sp. WSM1721]|uniref:hypothetical protein n=1 Tax=Ensifer sp. WSM1721 TaxID=1041159 RepID=UPI00047E1654|nr:hypothetical protein [Ensifer sp. WSM1721]
MPWSFAGRRAVRFILGKSADRHRQSFVWRAARSGLSLAVLLLCTGAAAAQDYPCKPEPEDNLGAAFRKLEIDPNYPVKFRMGQWRFAVPYAYGTGRKTPERVNCGPVRNRFEFAFWMPDLRAPKDDSWGNPDWRPQEPGRPRPGADEFLVKVPFAEEVTADTVPPAIMFKNLIELARGQYRLSFAHGGLIQLDRLGTEDDSQSTFVNLEDGRDELKITCYPPVVAEPACEFDLLFRDLSLTVNGMLPQNGVPQWRAVKAGIRTLLERWIVR